jgi:hypothetical protein
MPLLKALCNTSSDAAPSCVWPRLSSITICPIKDDTFHLLSDLIGSRSASGRAISRVVLQSFDAIPEGKLEWLREQVQLEESMWLC